MTPPLPDPLIPDADPYHTDRDALKALFERLRREKMSLIERSDILGECKGLWEGLYGPTRLGGSGKHRRPRPSFELAAPQWIGWTRAWIYYLLSLRELFSPEERAALKRRPKKITENDLRAVAQIRDVRKRAAAISALSDAENPAPSAQEAMRRAGLYLRAPAEQTHRQARSLLIAWRRANPDALKKFASWISARKPGFGPSIFTAVDVYLEEEGREL